jgi:hypothetical protein
MRALAASGPLFCYWRPPVRVPLIAGVIALSLVPATLVARDFNEPALGAAAAELADPARQEQVGALAGAMIGALMQLPVGGILRAPAEMDGSDAEAIDPATTVADLAGDDAAQAPQAAAEQLPRMMGMMAQMAGALDGMIPQLREMAETMARDLPPAE